MYAVDTGGCILESIRPGQRDVLKAAVWKLSRMAYILVSPWTHVNHHHDYGRSIHEYLVGHVWSFTVKSTDSRERDAPLEARGQELASRAAALPILRLLHYCTTALLHCTT